MHMETDVILYFDNDDDFGEFALEPMKVFSKTDADGNEIMYMQHQFSQKYKDAVRSGKKFCIKDPGSHVNKDGLLGTCWASYRIPAENIERYWDDEF